MGIFGEERVYPDEVPGPEDLFVRTKESVRCCKLVKWLGKQENDETKAGKDYDEAALVLVDLLKSTQERTGKYWAMAHYSELLQGMSSDEKKHLQYLRAMGEVLKVTCKC
jgi:hypothetical protein